MTPHAQIAAWDEGLAIALDDTALEWLDGWKTDRNVSLVTEGRRVLICPDDGSANADLRMRVSNRGYGAHSDFRHGTTFMWDKVQGDDLPRFALTELRLLPSNGGRYLYADIPADHLLPWPKLRDCASYDVPQQLVRDLEMRMRSCRDASPHVAPAKWQWVPMPKKFRDRLAPGVYGDVLRAVIAGVPYGAKVAA